MVRSRSDEGQAVALILIVVVFIVLAMVAAASLGHHMVLRGRAQVAADAAALAATSGGIAAARELAARNDAELVSYSSVGQVVTVVVAVHGITAMARATNGP